MCGIVGFTTYKKSVADSESRVRTMSFPLAHRGPDGEGYYVDEEMALGHRRLSIIDVEGGSQPMSSQGGRYQIVYNGEIYNYIELRKKLEVKGLVFRTQSDTEVLLQHFILSGADSLLALNGMFAFAIWDRQEKKLFLARDRIGIKPLYYTLHEGELIFASELKSLLLFPGVHRELSLLSLSRFLSLSYIPAPHTIFDHIHKLEPGAYLEFDGDTLQKNTYWDIPLADKPVTGQTLDECAEQVRSLLSDAVCKRLRSDVPVGVFLSGGIDSSTMVALAAQKVSSPLHTFSVGFEESSYDESSYAREVAKLYQTEHHHEILSSNRALDLLPEVMKGLDEPFADASILPTYLLSRFTSNHVKVCLGGDGSDELFAGYPSFQAHKLMEKLSFLPTTWRNQLNRLVRRLPVSHQYASVEFLLQQFIKGSGISPEIRFFMWMGVFSNEQKNHLLTEPVREQILRENPFGDIIDYVRQSRLISDFERILYLCMKMYLQDGILVKVDRASMANSLEVRVPFLDHTLVEFVSGIHTGYKLKGLTTKYILKYAVRDLLPRRIIKRRKAGFMIPLAKWIEHDLRGFIEEHCSMSALEEDGLFNPVYVRTLLDEHFQHKRDHRKLIWTILCFQIWRHHYR